MDQDNPFRPDSRIPVVLGDLPDATAGDAVLFEAPVRPWAGAAASFSPGQQHIGGCACCGGRVEAGRALGWLLHARARGNVPFFGRVIAVIRTEAGRAELAAALAGDPLAAACFRAEQSGQTLLWKPPLASL